MSEPTTLNISAMNLYAAIAYDCLRVTTAIHQSVTGGNLPDPQGLIDVLNSAVDKAKVLQKFSNVLAPEVEIAANVKIKAELTVN